MRKEEIRLRSAAARRRASEMITTTNEAGGGGTVVVRGECGVGVGRAFGCLWGLDFGLDKGSGGEGCESESERGCSGELP